MSHYEIYHRFQACKLCGTIAPAGPSLPHCSNFYITQNQTHLPNYTRTHNHTHTHTCQDSSGRVISSLQKVLPSQHKTNTIRISIPSAGFETEFSNNQAAADLRLNSLKPTGHVIHHQFNIQQLYALPTLYLCVLYLSENKQRLVPLTT